MSDINLRPVTEAELPLLAEILAELDGNAPFPLDQVRAKWREMQDFPDYVCLYRVKSDQGCRLKSGQGL